MGQVHRHAQVVHAVHHLDAEVAEPARVALGLSVADEVPPVVGDAGQAHAHAEQRVHPLDAVADGQVLQGGQETDLALLPGGQYLVRVAHPRDVVLRRHVGQHPADLGGNVLILHEGHVGGALEPAERAGGGYRRPAPGLHRLVAVLVAAGAEELDEPVHVLRQQEGVLVNVNHHRLVHDALEAGLLGCVQRHLRRRHPPHFTDHLENLRDHGHPSLQSTVKRPRANPFRRPRKSRVGVHMVRQAAPSVSAKNCSTSDGLDTIRPGENRLASFSVARSST